MLMNITCSMVLHEIDVKEIGLLFTGLHLFPLLKTGDTVLNISKLKK